MANKIDKIIGNCIKCLLCIHKHRKQEGELHPLHKEETLLQTYHIDHLDLLELTNKNINIFCL